MNNRKRVVLLIGLLLLFFSPNICFSGPGEFGLALKGGTLGAGIEATVGITQSINARLGFNYFEWDSDSTESNVEYSYDVDLMTVSLLVDWHPLDNGFRVSVGALYNGNEAEATGKATNGNYIIDDTTYTSAEVGTLKGEIDFDSFAPYIGIGYGNAVGKDKRWSFVFDLGVMYQGSPDVSFSTNGTLSSNSAFLAELENERRQLESEIKDLQFYPVIFIGVSYKF